MEFDLEQKEFCKRYSPIWQIIIWELRYFHKKQADISRTTKKQVHHKTNCLKRINFYEALKSKYLTEKEKNMPKNIILNKFILDNRIENESLLLQYNDGKIKLGTENLHSPLFYHSNPISTKRMCSSQLKNGIHCPLYDYFGWCDMVHVKNLHAGDVVFTYLTSKGKDKDKNKEYIYIYSYGLVWPKSEINKWSQKMEDLEQSFYISNFWKKVNVVEKDFYFYKFGKRKNFFNAFVRYSILPPSISPLKPKMLYCSSLLPENKEQLSFFKKIISFDELMEFYKLNWNTCQLYHFSRILVFNQNQENDSLLNQLLNGLLSDIFFNSLKGFNIPLHFNLLVQNTCNPPSINEIEKWISIFGGTNTWKYLGYLTWLLNYTKTTKNSKIESTIILQAIKLKSSSLESLPFIDDMIAIELCGLVDVNFIEKNLNKEDKDEEGEEVHYSLGIFQLRLSIFQKRFLELFQTVEDEKKTKKEVLICNHQAVLVNMFINRYKNDKHNKVDITDKEIDFKTWYKKNVSSSASSSSSQPEV